MKHTDECVKAVDEVVLDQNVNKVNLLGYYDGSSTE